MIVPVSAIGRRCIGALLGLVWATSVCAGGGPLGIDHKLGYDDSGIWKRDNQLALVRLMIAGEIAGGLWEGGETRLGKTLWQSIDATVLGAVASTAMKAAFTRARPYEMDDPDKWFQGDSHHSFPSGEVTTVSAIVTPFVLEYGREYPAVWALEALPAYDAIARMKVQAHWQTDVLAGFALGTAAGYYAHARPQSIVLNLLPDRFTVGLRKSW